MPLCKPFSNLGTVQDFPGIVKQAGLTTKSVTILSFSFLRFPTGHIRDE
jgi:hypothetical protein